MEGSCVDCKSIITCSVISNPKPLNYSWDFNGQPLHSKITGVNTSTLVIDPVLHNDFGNYTCHVTNVILGVLTTTLFTISLMPYQPPGVPIMFAFNSTSSSIYVEWMPEYNGGTPQKFTVSFHLNDTGINDVIWKANIDDVDDSRLSVLIVGLKSNSTYIITITSVNSNPVGLNSSQLLFAVKTKGIKKNKF